MPALQVSRKVDYAFRALLHIARHQGTQACTLASIAARVAVSPQFLAKIVEELAHRGLVRSRRAAGGGYVLARPAAAITFNDVIAAVEGPIAVNSCLDGHDDCTLLGSCGMMPVWQEAQRRLVDLFSTTTLADVGACRVGQVGAVCAGRADASGGPLVHAGEISGATDGAGDAGRVSPGVEA